MTNRCMHTRRILKYGGRRERAWVAGEKMAKKVIYKLTFNYNLCFLNTLVFMDTLRLRQLRGLCGPLRPAPLRPAPPRPWVPQPAGQGGLPARHLCGTGRLWAKSLGCGLRGGLPASTAGWVRGGYGESAGSIFGLSTHNAVS